ncbi:histone H2A.Z-specific chaperone CHZ1-like [Morus notabilis]|nr:histone H2A.Z-specific chaperone CHZ1-like [Morus notabilis]
MDDNENNKGNDGENSKQERNLEGDSEKKSVLKSDEKVASEGKVEPGESSKDSDVTDSVPVPEEEDLGWDEIEDLSSIDEKKVTHSGSPNRAELRKRLSAVEEEADLSWDIEDDDDDKPTKG